MPTTPRDVFGVISVVSWSITFLVSIRYVALVMRADTDGWLPDPAGHVRGGGVLWRQV